MNSPASANEDSAVVTDVPEKPDLESKVSPEERDMSKIEPEDDDSPTGRESDENNKKTSPQNESAPEKVAKVEGIEEEEDEEIRLAMEMALAAAQNPHLSPAEIQKLVGEKNEQTKLIAKQKEEKLEKGERWNKKKEQVATWWSAAAKRAEEIKDRAERRLYSEQIRKDPEIIEMRKKMKILKKTLKAHRLQGNRVDTRHVFKRQRNEKKLLSTYDKLKKTQRMFTNSSYNVQEYLKAMMRASKKWRKKGTDEELMLEAQLCRNMHQMLALEKQKVKLKKETKEMKKYLQRCKGWLSDKKSFCEMNLMTLRTTQNSILNLYEETLRRQDALIAKLKASDEFKDVDLSDVDVSHIDLPKFKEVASSPMRGLPINDSIRVKKDRENSSHESKEAQRRAAAQAKSRAELVGNYYKQQQQQASLYANGPELIVDTAKDEVSVSSHLSDPDASGNGELEDSESNFNFGNDAPWMASDPNLDAVDEEESSDEEPEQKSTPKPSLDALNGSDDDEMDKKPAAKKSAPPKKTDHDTVEDSAAFEGKPEQNPAKMSAEGKEQFEPQETKPNELEKSHEKSDPEPTKDAATSSKEPKLDSVKTTEKEEVAEKAVEREDKPVEISVSNDQPNDDSAKTSKEEKTEPEETKPSESSGEPPDETS